MGKAYEKVVQNREKMEETLVASVKENHNLLDYGSIAGALFPPKNKRKQRRQMYLHEIYHGQRVHPVTWGIFTIWSLILIILITLLIYAKSGNYSIG